MYTTSEIDLATTALADQRCIGCGGPTGGLCGAWSPTVECRRDDLRIEPDRPVRLAYPICPACARRCASDPGHIQRVEDRIIARFHAARRRPPRPVRTGALRLAVAP